LLTTSERGCASAGRGDTSPINPVSTSAAFRSKLRSTFILAVSISSTVPSFQFATYAYVPVGLSATAVGSEPTATSPASSGMPFSPPMRTSF
jgi:hypothetical protein